MSTTTIGAIVHRDDWTCCYCREVLRRDGLTDPPIETIQSEDSRRFTFDHVKARSKGGKWKPDNIVVACVECNSSKGDCEIDDSTIEVEIQRRISKPIDRKRGREIGDRLYPWAPEYRAREAARSLARYNQRKGDLMSAVKRILIVDLSHRFWSIALGGGLTDSAAPRDLVIKEIRAHANNYDRIIIACDGKTKSFRSALWPGYKAKRTEREERLWTLLDDTARLCDSAGWHVLRAPEHPDYDGLTYEADDVIGSVVAWARDHSIDADILTGDSDLAQLVDDSFKIKMLRVYKGTHALNESGVREWLGVPPCMVADLKALGGDSGDGYGDTFQGLGEKTAKAMLAATNGSALEAIKATIASAKKSALRDTILAIPGGAEERVKVGLRLAQVCIDVPLDLESIREVKEIKARPEVTADLLPAKPAIQERDDSHDRDLSEPEAISGEAVPALASPPPGAPINPPIGSSIVIHSHVDPAAKMLASPIEARHRLTEFRGFIQEVLVEGVDYGTIPGCGSKPCLMKSGAEKLGEIYGYVPTFKIETAIEKFDDEDPMFFYRIKCILLRKADGMKVAECIGSANSKETKWASRWVFPNEVPAHLEIEKLRMRKIKIKKGADQGKWAEQYRIPNEQIFDQVNTIVKIAEKRAFVGAMLIATRASGVFAVDIDSIPPEALGTVADKQQWETP